MDSESSSNSSFLGTHLPITLLGLAFCLYFVTQLQEANIEAEGLELQKVATIKTHETLDKQLGTNGKELEERKAPIAQAEKIQEDFAKESKTVKELSTSAAQIDALNKKVVELNKLMEQAKPRVEASQTLQKQFTDLMKDLDSLKRLGDKDAEEIIKAFGIQINDNPTKEADKPEDKKPEEKKEDKK